MLQNKKGFEGNYTPIWVLNMVQICRCAAVKSSVLFCGWLAELVEANFLPASLRGGWINEGLLLNSAQHLCNNQMGSVSTDIVRRSAPYREMSGHAHVCKQVDSFGKCSCLFCPHCNRVFCVAGELLSQPRPEGLTEIVCPKNGSERVNVALVYPPMPTVLSPSPKWPECPDCGLWASPNHQGLCRRLHFSVFI